jgi:hypothetical protein
LFLPLLFVARETMGTYTEELQTLKGVEKELGKKVLTKTGPCFDLSH